MAKRKSTTSAPKSNRPRGKKWSELKPGTKKKYKAAGVTPAKYNAWRNPKTQANAKKKGQTREQFLGLRPNQISGASKESFKAQARKNMERVFGAQPRFNPEGVRKFIAEVEPERWQAIAKGSEDDLWDWAFNGDPEHSDDYSKGKLFYH